MSEKRISEAERDRLASELHKKLRRQRLRPGLWFLAALPLLGLLIFGIWKTVKMPAALPPVMLVGYDALVIADPETSALVEAQLVAPGDPSAKLDDLEIFWEVERIGQPERLMTKTDGGIARHKIDKILAGETIPVRVWFIDPLGSFRRDDRARVDVVGKGDIQIVAIEDVAAANEPIDWLSEKAAGVPVRPEVAKIIPGQRAVYCSGEVSPAIYRSMRRWLQSKFDQKGGLPTGVLLRKTPGAVETELRDRGLTVKRTIG